jgi:thiol-disulfide isomerase/thioredoxin
MTKNIWQRRQFLYLGLGTLGASAVTSLGVKSDEENLPLGSPLNAATVDRLTNTNPTTDLATETGSPLPEFQGIQEWLNSPPLTRADLRGHVVLLQFWTLACINCQRTLPYITSWHRQYADQGLKVIGVHTPEIAFERKVSNIRSAMKRHGINYPVAVDNNFQTWKAYNNEYWPHLFLANRQGKIVYDHIGEGAYQETERTIQRLLRA